MKIKLSKVKKNVLARWAKTSGDLLAIHKAFDLIEAAYELRRDVTYTSAEFFKLCGASQEMTHASLALTLGELSAENVIAFDIAVPSNDGKTTLHFDEIWLIPNDIEAQVEDMVISYVILGATNENDNGFLSKIFNF